MSLGCKINKIHTVIICMLAVFISFMCITLNVRADYKEYWIHDAKFDIEFSENGDAVVTETWNIEFHGDFTRFYKEFNTKDLDIIEKYNSLDVKNVKINGVDCEKAFNDRDREDYTYYLKPTNKGIQLEFYYGAHNEYVEYQVTYTLKGVVKEVINGSAIFCYRLIGANFSKNVSDIEINLSGTGLDRNNLDIRHLTDEENYKIENKDNGYRLTNSRGYKEKTVLKLNVALDKNSFTGLKQVDSRDLKNNLKENSKSLFGTIFGAIGDAITFVVIGIFKIIIYAVIIFTVGLIGVTCEDVFSNPSKLKDYKKFKNSKKKFEDNPKYPDECISKFKELNINILGFYYKNEKLRFRRKFEIYLAGLRVHGVLRIEKKEGIVINNDYYRKVNNIEYKTFEAIIKLIGINECNGKQIIDFDSLKDIILGSNKEAIDKREQIKKHINTLMDYYNKYFECNDEFYDRIEFMYYYIKWAKLINECSTYNVLKHGLDFKNAIIWMYTGKFKTVKSKLEYYKVRIERSKLLDIKRDLDSIGLEDLFDLLDLIHQNLEYVPDTIVNSGSGCSSCSSCSSCGGCGGGGAD